MFVTLPALNFGGVFQFLAHQGAVPRQPAESRPPRLLGVHGAEPGVRERAGVWCTLCVHVGAVRRRELPAEESHARGEAHRPDHQDAAGHPPPLSHHRVPSGKVTARDRP